jgi:uncharacterized SAM-binding protein YcdF (DUF218 family)
MIFGGKKKNWDDEYDDYYTQRDPEYDRRVKPLLWIHIIAILTVGTVFLVIVGASAGGTMVEKVLKELASPVGLVWVGLALVVYFALVYKAGWTAVCAFLCWLTLTVGGNWFVSNYLASSLEQPYTETNPFAQDSPEYDYLIVLGGGTQISPTGSAQLSDYGDRIMAVARLYHLGKTKKVVATGRQRYKTDPKDLHPGEETIQILNQLKVPMSDMSMLGGINTSEELQQVSKWLDTVEGSKDLKIGLLTSAWHLPRAMQLAQANEVNAHPVPANFISHPYSPNPGIVIPSARNLRTTATMLHERLGRMMGR